jgi:hypothetical protein
MASIAPTTAGTIAVIEPGIQATLPAAVALLAGDTVSIDSAGKWVKGDADGSGTLPIIYGIALRSVAAGEICTAQRTGLLGGYAWASTAYMSLVYAADTAGEITVTASESNGGSADVVIGFVEAVWDHLIGGTPTKALRLDIK